VSFAVSEHFGYLLGKLVNSTWVVKVESFPWYWCSFDSRHFFNLQSVVGFSCAVRGARRRVRLDGSPAG
jgi:hypothetical protein